MAVADQRDAPVVPDRDGVEAAEQRHQGLGVGPELGGGPDARPVGDAGGGGGVGPVEEEAGLEAPLRGEVPDLIGAGDGDVVARGVADQLRRRAERVGAERGVALDEAVVLPGLQRVGAEEGLGPLGLRVEGQPLPAVVGDAGLRPVVHDLDVVARLTDGPGQGVGLQDGAVVAAAVQGQDADADTKC